METPEERYFNTAVHVELFDRKRGYRWTQRALHRDAQLRQLDKHGVYPGPQFQLRAARDADPETGGPFDVDGDRAMDRLYLHGAEIHVSGESIIVTGYTPIGNDDGGDGPPFDLARWTQVPYAWVERADAERAENEAKADGFSEPEQELLIALRKAERELYEKGGSGSIELRADGSAVSVSGRDVTLPEVRALNDAHPEVPYLIGINESTDTRFRRSERFEVNRVYFYTPAEHIADVLISRERVAA